MTLETGEIAWQASGAVVVNMADTVVLVPWSPNRKTKEDRISAAAGGSTRSASYAAGRVSGGFPPRGPS